MNEIRPYKQILQFLTEVIEQTGYSPSYKLPSERMLATKFGASRRSVRLAFETLINQGVIVSIHGKGYFTTGNKKNARVTASPTIQKIYFITPALRTDFAQNILSGITDYCDKHTLDVSIKITKSDPKKETQYIRTALSSDAKGIILFPSDNELINNELLKLSANRYPIAIIDRYFRNINSSFISTDNYNAMLGAVQFLHSRHHKNLLYLTSPNSLATVIEERLSGFLAGLKKYYGENEKANVLTFKDFVFDEIRSVMIAYLKKNPTIDVIITPGLPDATDAIIAAVHALKRSIPQDIKLMVFDNDFSFTEIELLRPYVIQQDAYEIGYRSAAALYNQIYGDLRPESIRLPVSIIDCTKKRERDKLLK